MYVLCNNFCSCKYVEEKNNFWLQTFHRIYFGIYQNLLLSRIRYWIFKSLYKI